MQPKRSITAPLYIPEDFLQTYGAEARAQVARRPPRPAPALRPGNPTEARIVRLAAFAGVALWGALVALWSWLALQSGSPVWTAVAVIGAATLVLAAVALPRVTALTRRLAAPGAASRPPAR